jgi:exodeoxyribonuclease VII small subunit
MAKKPEPDPTLPALGYEEARAALAEIVAALESGDATLEEALALWEKGEEYARICDAWLAGAQDRLTAQQESAEPSG